MNTALVTAPTREEVSRQAYAIWEACGRPTDCEHQHWARAERELTKDRQQADDCRCGLGKHADQDQAR